MHYTTILSLAAGLASVQAHMVLDLPTPYNKDTLNNSPLAADGSDYPCKANGVYKSSGSTPMPLGSSQPLAFKGSAVHGGGSCQVSITYDKNPTKDSVFKVIHSIVGGCPAGAAGNLPENPNGNGASRFTFQIPTDLPTGEATLAWTWFNRIGNREMYMNCAPITITGGSGGGGGPSGPTPSKKMVRRDQSALGKYPDMFKANIGNGCSTSESKDLEFPNPGASVEKAGQGATGPPTGNCAGGGGNGGSTGNGGGAGAGAGSGSGNGSGTGPSSPPPSYAPGVFSPNAAGAAPSGGAPAPTPTPTPAGATPQETASAGTYGGNGGGNAPPTTSQGSPPASGAQTGPCTSEGAFLCLPGGKAFQQCGSGQWSAVTQMAAGTSCAPQTGSLKVNVPDVSTQRHRKRHLRFSHGHLRRVSET